MKTVIDILTEKDIFDCCCDEDYRANCYSCQTITELTPLIKAEKRVLEVLDNLLKKVTRWSPCSQYDEIDFSMPRAEYEAFRITYKALNKLRKENGIYGD